MYQRSWRVACSVVLLLCGAVVLAKQVEQACGTRIAGSREEIFLHQRHSEARRYSRAAMSKAAAAANPDRTTTSVSGDIVLMDDQGGTVGQRNPFSLDNRTVNWVSEASPQKTGNLSYLICGAAHNGQAARLAWLLAYGADPNARSTYNGKTCYELALLDGHDAVARTLLEHGALASELEGVDAFVAAAARGDRERCAALALAHPEYVADSEPLVSAAGRGDARTVGFLLDLGMDPNRSGKHCLALNAGWSHRAVCELLVERGADPRGRTHGGTAAGWAVHGKDLEQARFLAEKSRLLLDAVMTGHVSLASDLVKSDPEAVRERSPWGNTPLHELPEDPDTAELLLSLLLDAGADPNATNQYGQTPQQALEAAGRDEAVDRLEARLSDQG